MSGMYAVAYEGPPVRCEPCLLEHERERRATVLLVYPTGTKVPVCRTCIPVADSGRPLA